MFTKAIVLVALFCAVKGNVVINIYGDDVDTVRESSNAVVSSPEDLRSCNPRWCEQQCRRMGFRGGVCVHDRCKCDVLTNEVEKKVELCDFNVCNEQCRRKGLLGGTCEGIRCVCFLNNKENELLTLHSREVDDCNLRWCEQQCHRMGFPGGVCVGDRCKCDIIAGDSELLTLHSREVDDCNLRWCEQQCHRMGFPGGVCVGDRCKCDIIAGDSELPILHSRGVDDCNLRWCEQQCRRMGFPGGVCVGDRCKCDIIAGDSELPTLHTREVDDCNLRWCEQQCHRMGFPGGVCVGDRCKCDIIAGDSGTELKTFQEPVPAVRGTCSELACQLRCQSMGYHDGTCIGADCTCIMLKTEDSDSKDITDNEIPTDKTDAKTKDAEKSTLIQEHEPKRSMASYLKKHCNWNHCFLHCIRQGKRFGFCTPFHTCMCSPEEY